MRHCSDEKISHNLSELQRLTYPLLGNGESTIVWRVGKTSCRYSGVCNDRGRTIEVRSMVAMAERRSSRDRWPTEIPRLSGDRAEVRRRSVVGRSSSDGRLSGKGPVAVDGQAKIQLLGGGLAAING
ncbi:hypothetical protein KFK09_007541 [Dendrobium nobile]|uniref:Uncharacterized protein n=1 Tax=Dendrobium nobile TaxID=94219 RepID=A0A8T3BVJ5_DENNO|nr:hypothetical protein KFK09_007541 [Dendrobium nobile]